MTAKIERFVGEYFFLSNFFDHRCVLFEGRMYRNSEAAYQAAKSLDPAVRDRFTNIDPATAKQQGKARNLRLRPDWESVKNDVMYRIVKDKFTRHPHLTNLLLSTGTAELVEGNHWHDTYWGVCDGTCRSKHAPQGRNELGKILMRVRDDLRTLGTNKKDF